MNTPWSKRPPTGEPHPQTEEERRKLGALGECIERLIKAIEANTAVQTQLLARFPEFRGSSPGAANLGSGTAFEGAVTASGPAAQGSSFTGAGAKESPERDLSQEEFAGLIFTLFCHHGSGAFDQDLLRELLQSRIPSLTFAIVYREGMAIGDKYTDTKAGNPIRYWRVSLESKHLLLPCPAKSEAFYGTEGFDVGPPGSAIGPSTLEFCLPALLNREGDAWYIKDKGQLCSVLPPREVNWKDYRYLLNQKGAGTPEPAASSPQPIVPAQTVSAPPVPPPARPTPLADRLAKAYVSFCQEGRGERRPFARMHELWKQSAVPDCIVAHPVQREPGRILLCEEGREHFWLVHLENSSADGWLFPCVTENQFVLLEPAYPQRGVHLSPHNLLNMTPATVSKPLGLAGKQPQPWQIQTKGELYRK